MMLINTNANTTPACRLAPSMPRLGTSRRLSLLVLGGPQKKEQSQQNQPPRPGLGFGGPQPADQRQGQSRRRKSSGKAARPSKPPGGALTSPVDQWLAAACNPRGRLKVRRRVVAPGLHGLVAAEGIMKGDLILEVPSKLSIKAEEDAGFESREAAAALQLLKRRDEQRLLPWLRALPKEVPLPSLWSNEELEATQDAEVLMHDCIEHRKKLFKGCQDQSEFPWEEMVWAMSIVKSRGHELGGPFGRAMAVIPGMDFVNHSPVPNACIGVDFPPRNRQQAFNHGLIALRNIRAGEEITTNYNENLCFDEDYLITYGYLPPQPAGNLLFPDLLELIKRYHDQALLAKALQETNRAKQARILVEINHQLEHPEGVRSAAKALLLKLVMAGQMEALSQDKFGLGVDADGRFHPSLVRAATAVAEAYQFCPFPGNPDCRPGLHEVAFLRNHCNVMMYSFPTSCEEDAELLAGEGSSMTAAMRTAVEFRMRKKAALKAALSHKDNEVWGEDVMTPISWGRGT